MGLIFTSAFPFVTQVNHKMLYLDRKIHKRKEK